MWVPTGGRDALRDAALEYAGWGWRVAPAHYAHWPGRHRRTRRRPEGNHPGIPPVGCSCAKRGCTTPGGHPVGQDWAVRASAARAAVLGWWGHVRPWNIALVTGEQFDVWTVPAAVARAALRSIEAGDHPLGPVAYGPRGWQFFSAPVGGAGAYGWDLPPGMSYSGRDRYVLAAPSDGAARVRWYRGPFGGGTPRMPPWESTLDALLGGARSSAVLSRTD